jgi:hypothetical protein
VPKYYVVFRQGPSVSSDAAVGAKPTATSEVLSERLDAKLANVEAASVADAQRAARIAYPGEADSTPLVVVEAELKES